MASKTSPLPWYKDGLRFECTQCGQCCTGGPGYTWVTDEEIQIIAAHLQISTEDFIKKYLRKVGKRWSLLEHPKTYDCVFLKDNKCSIYQVRPRQCQTFPWWAQNLQSPEAWKRASEKCEGINPLAPTTSFDAIQQVLEKGAPENGSSS